MVVSWMQVLFHLGNLLQKVLFVIVMHVIVSIAFEMLHWYLAKSISILLLTLSRLTAYFRVGIADLSLLLVHANIFALWQVANPLRLVFTDPNIVVLVNVLAHFHRNCDFT